MPGHTLRLAWGGEAKPGCCGPSLEQKSPQSTHQPVQVHTNQVTLKKVPWDKHRWVNKRWKTQPSSVTLTGRVWQNWPTTEVEDSKIFCCLKKLEKEFGLYKCLDSRVKPKLHLWYPVRGRAAHREMDEWDKHVNGELIKNRWDFQGDVVFPVFRAHCLSIWLVISLSYPKLVWNKAFTQLCFIDVSSGAWKSPWRWVIDV